MDSDYEETWFQVRRDEEEEIRQLEDQGEDSTKQMPFVLALKKYPVLLDKSQTPKVKAEKKSAVERLARDLEATTGEKLTESKIYKKINNMKTTLKKKTDKNATGNKKIELNRWEKIFLDLLQPASNPVFSKVPGSVSIGVKRSTLQASSAAASTSQDSGQLLDDGPSRELVHVTQPPSFQVNHQVRKPPPPPAQAKRQKVADSHLLENETEETRNLTTPQLQRFVLLKQLELIKLKIQRQKSTPETAEDSPD